MPRDPDAEPRNMVSKIRHVDCPECGNRKAVVAATHYAHMMCFCPRCEHVWECDTPTEGQGTASGRANRD